VTDRGEQLQLVRTEAARGRATAASARAASPSGQDLAAELPVARVVVDIEPMHLDRLWDYAVPAKLDAAARPGARVRVRFAGQLVDGFVWDRIERSEFAGALAPLSSVVSPEPVLSPRLGRLARAVADAYCGTLAAVLHLAIPPRHARVEKAAPEPVQESAVHESAAPEPTEPDASEPDASAEPPSDTAAAAPSGEAAVSQAPSPDPQHWKLYEHGPEFLAALAAGEKPRAVWTALPGPDWTRAYASAAHAALHSGRGALIVVPDGRDVERVDAALLDELGPGRHVALTADLGPAERYRRWLTVSRGAVTCVVGTRAATFAPIANLGLAAIWDDGDSSLADRAAPYPHAREVLILRAHHEAAGMLIGGYAVTAEAAQLVTGRWARPVAAVRATVREHAPLVRAVDPDRDAERDPMAAAARIPTTAWRAAREGLRSGPVLIQVPRAGYLPSLACVRCRESARCVHCHGPLALAAANRSAHCGWCGRDAVGWRCTRCEADRFRARSTGVARSAEELGRAFPGVPVRLSHGGAVIARVGSQPTLVVATPGAEPAAEGGYAAAVLLDGAVGLAIPTLRAAEQALRRWLGAACLVRPAAQGGTVLVAADPAAAAVQALVRWDPAGFARRELADRADLGYPPSARIAELTGSYAAIRELIAEARLADAVEVLGPTPLDPARTDAAAPHRALLRSPRRSGPALTQALRAAQGVRSARKADEFVRVRVDPLDLA
jgi:primosomal protein N' (replication factor Y) (superfamily II helicase)